LKSKLNTKTALGNTGTPARHSQTKDKPSGHWSPSKGNSVKKKRKKKGGQKPTNWARRHSREHQPSICTLKI